VTHLSASDSFMTMALYKFTYLPWHASFSDVHFIRFWHLTNLWYDSLLLHDLLRLTCSFLRPCSFSRPVCECFVADWLYFFSMFLSSVVSAILSNICRCTVTVVAWHPLHTFSCLLYCALVFRLDQQPCQCLVGLHGCAYFIFTEYPLSCLR